MYNPGWTKWQVVFEGDNLEGCDGWEVGRRFKRVGNIYIYIQLVHADVILQLKINKFFTKKVADEREEGEI